METFTKLKKLIKNPHYQDQRKESLADLNDDMIDQPIIKIINSIIFSSAAQIGFGKGRKIVMLYRSNQTDLNMKTEQH